MRFLAALILMPLLAMPGDEPKAAEARATRLREMRTMAEAITIDDTAPGGQGRLERLPEPVYRFDVADRNVTDGTVWIWGRSGRPSAVMTLTKHRAGAQGPHWLTELTSLASGSLSGEVDGIGDWQPSRAGLDMRRFPSAPPPAADTPERLRQMRDLVRQIKARENSRTRPRATPKPVQYYELRVLPQPVHRYADARSGLIDGGLFLISYGLNPEAILLIEARQNDADGPAWHCGFARATVMDLQVEYAGNGIWSNRDLKPSGPEDPYWLFTRPIVGE